MYIYKYINNNANIVTDVILNMYGKKSEIFITVCMLTCKNAQNSFCKRAIGIITKFILSIWSPIL